ncbi:MAG: RNase H-like domain-containing protein, partial [Candidatus Paceibacterota bacterium]
QRPPYKRDTDLPSKESPELSTLSLAKKVKFIDQARPHPRCFTCGVEGHIASQCPSRASSSKGLMLMEATTPTSPGPDSVPSSSSNDPDPPTNSVEEFTSLPLLTSCIDETFQITVAVGDYHQIPALIDTGSSISLISEFLKDALNVSTTKTPLANLRLGDGRFIETPPVTEPIQICYGQVSCLHSFHVMNTGFAVIIGKDLLPKIGISLVYTPAALKVPNIDDGVCSESEESSSDPHPDQHLIDQHPEIQHLLDQLNLNTGFCSHEQATFSIRVPEGTPPIWRRQYPIPLIYHQAVQEQIYKWFETGVIRYANPGCRWNLPLTTAPKRNPEDTTRKTGRRVCLDPTALNPFIEDIHYQLPRIQDLLEMYCLNGGVFSIIDLKDAFNSIKMDEPAQEMCSFTWQNKRFSFVACPFGIKTIPSFFQNLMATMFDGLQFVGLYLDDIVVYSKSMEDHLQHLTIVLKRMMCYNLRTNIAKCNLGFTKLRVLGHIISHGKIQVDPWKIPLVNSMTMPTTGKAVERFLGFTNYFRAHIPYYAQLAAPLEKVRKLKSFTPSQECISAFEKLREALKHSIPIHSIREDQQLYLACDASTSGIGAVLFQLNDDNERLYISCISRALSTSEKNYSATALEMQALTWSIQKWHQCLYGRKFIVLTDHKSLTHMLDKQNPSSHVKRNLETLLSYDFTVFHIPGKENILPDILSRLHSERKSDQLMLIQAQPATNLKKFISESLDKELPTEEERQYLLKKVHDVHSGATSMFRRLLDAEGVYWPSMLQDCKQLVQTCPECQMFATKHNGYQPLKSVPAYRPFDAISIDYFGPMPTTPRGSSYVLVCVDDCSGFIVLRAIPDKSAIESARALWNVYADFGVPMKIRSDRGTEFVNTLVRQIHSLLGVNHRVTAPYHPNANGKAESAVKLAKSALTRLAHEDWYNWDTFLATVQMGLNQRIPQRTGTAPFALMFARPFNSFQDYSGRDAPVMSPEEWTRHLDDFHVKVLGGLKLRTDEHDASGKGGKSLTTSPPSLNQVQS